MTPTEPRGGEGLSCPFCGGPAKTFPMNGAIQAGCAGDFKDCAGSDVMAPVAMWNRRPPVVHRWPEREVVTEAFRKHGLEGFDDLEAAILSLFPPVVGWRMVPVEPTPEMHAAGNRITESRLAPSWTTLNVYRAMLAAAPLTDGVGE